MDMLSFTPRLSEVVNSSAGCNEPFQRLLLETIKMVQEFSGASPSTLLKQGVNKTLSQTIPLIRLSLFPALNNLRYLRVCLIHSVFR